MKKLKAKAYAVKPRPTWAEYKKILKKQGVKDSLKVRMACMHVIDNQIEHDYMGTGLDFRHGYPSVKIEVELVR